MQSTTATARPTADTPAEDLSTVDLSLPDSKALVHHPDGYYWLGADGRLQIGPYATAEEALADLHRSAEDDIEPEESLLEAEQALGLSDWLDPDTGGLAEATHTRLEDH